MRYVEVQDGIMLNVNSIEAIRKPDALDEDTQVFTHHRKYRSKMSYDTIVAIIKEEESVDRKVGDGERINDTMRKLSTVLDSVQHNAL